MGAYTVKNGKIYGLMGFYKNPLELNDLGWDEIQQLIQAGKFGDYFKVGDTKDITLNLPAGSSDLVAGQYFSEAVSGTYKVVVLGIDHNSTYEGTNRVHFCIGQDSTGKEIAFRTMKMNTSNTNVGGWAGCGMRTWLNETLINGLPSDLVSVITPCTKYTDNTGNSSNVEANVTATSDKLWLLSEFEVFGIKDFANQYEKDKQAQYDYYKNGASKVRYQHQSTGSTSDWWLRSALYNASSRFCFVDIDGTTATNNANYNRGVVPGFTISNISKVIPSLILRAWRNKNWYLADTTVPYYSSYSSEIPELETSSITINDARYLGYYLDAGSRNYVGVYIMIETNSDGAVSINEEFSNYASLSSEGNGKYLVTINTPIADRESGITVTKDLIITVGETSTYEELSKTLSITFKNGYDEMVPNEDYDDSELDWYDPNSN